MMVMMTHTTTEYDGESVSNDIHEEDGELVFKWILKEDDFVFFWMINENELQVSQRVSQRDEFLTEELTNHLFQVKVFTRLKL